MVEAHAVVNVLHKVTILSNRIFDLRHFAFIICQDGEPIFIFAYMEGWKMFISVALLTFNPFIEDGAIFSNNAAKVWLFIVAETKDKHVQEVSSILDTYVDRISLLMSVKDPMGRKAIDVATPKYKQAMLEKSYLFGRYEIRDGPAEHVSETCKVYLARDHQDGGRNVALKFICDLDHFEREVIVRQNCLFDDKYVISTLRPHDGNDGKDKIFGDEAVKKGYYRRCLVMPAAERNLGTVLMHEHIAGRDWDQLRMISKQLIEALNHVHEKGYVHGDVKRKRLFSI